MLFRSASSTFTIDAAIPGRGAPSFHLNTSATSFAFQEWGGIVHGLTNIAVKAAFEAELAGPPSALQTRIALRSDGGDVEATVRLDSTVPGWHAQGDASVRRLDLARWLNRADRASDITGDATVDVDLQIGRAHV